MAMRTPMALSCRRVSTAPAASSISALSVISSRSRSGAIPAAQLLARLTQYRHAERRDQPRLLGERDEVHGADQPALRVVPAGQRLEAGDLARSERDDRLVVRHDLARL